MKATEDKLFDFLKDVNFGDGALFAALKHEYRPRYWFVFYAERLDKIWILSSKEFIRESNQNKNGKNIGLRSIWFNGKNTKKITSPSNRNSRSIW